MPPLAWTPPPNHAADLLTLRIHLQKAESLRLKQRWDEAIAECATAGGVLERLVELGCPAPSLLEQSFTLDATTGMARVGKGDVPGARKMLRQALRRVPERTPPAWVPVVVAIHRNLLPLHYIAGDLEEALHNGRAALQLVLEQKAHANTAEGKRAVQLLQAQVHQLELMTGVRSPENRSEHMILIQGLRELRLHARAVGAYRHALDDKQIREDLANGHLYNAACMAALAFSEAEGKTAASLRKQALSWLREDAVLRAARLAKFEAKELRPENLEQLRSQAQAHIEHARFKDPDLAVLRGTPEFEALFGATRPTRDSKKNPKPVAGDK